jgi:hypothetical protein
MDVTLTSGDLAQFPIAATERDTIDVGTFSKRFAAEASEPLSDIMYPENLDGVRPEPLGDGCVVPRSTIALIEEKDEEAEILPPEMFLKDAEFAARVAVKQLNVLNPHADELLTIALAGGSDGSNDESEVYAKPKACTCASTNGVREEVVREAKWLLDAVNDMHELGELSGDDVDDSDA